MKQESKNDFLANSLVVKRIKQSQLGEKNTGDKPDNEQLLADNMRNFIKIKEADSREREQRA